MCWSWPKCTFFFFFNDTATAEIYTLSLHDALPDLTRTSTRWSSRAPSRCAGRPSRRASTRSSARPASTGARRGRSEEHTSELQSRQYLVCRLLLENKKQANRPNAVFVVNNPVCRLL